MKVLVTDQVFGGLDIERSVLAPLGAEVIEAPATDEATLAGLAKGAAGLLVCYAPLTEAVLEAAAPTCRIVARYGIGYDNVPVAAATRLGMVVTNVPDYCLDEVADHTLALLLAVARGVAFSDREVRGGGWQVPRAGIHRLGGRRLAVLGMGRIGQRVASRALAFGLRATGYDPFLAELPGTGVERAATLEEAVAEADFITLHLPLTAESRHIIGPAVIGHMRRAPVLINTARGGLVDLNAAAVALECGALSAVALDVTEPEPLPEGHLFRRHPRALITPHTSFYSAESQAQLQLRAAEEVARSLRGEPPRCPVNPEVLPK